MTTQLTKKELQLMTVLWNSSIALSANDISNINPDLNKNTIQVVLKKLLDKELIKVDNIGYSGTVLTRLYVPVVSQEAYVSQSLTNQTMKKLVANFIDSSDTMDDLSEIEKRIAQKKKELLNEE
ncbi:MAG: BlaI/MecI/CopY family transcriptional regulator [Streptococcaceae bacterium]|jgi:predicted transcriptional regulator|nr:BlaI/MecI/CopY family transcriptional regulator [Streptococcaceae bacterium]